MPFNYIYKITNKTTGEYYYGVRSCSGHWKDDSYMGSGILLKRKMKAHPDHEWIKEVLLVFDTPEEAYEYEEVILQGRHIGCDTHDGFCLNMRQGGVGGRTAERSTVMINQDGVTKRVAYNKIRSYLNKGFSFKSNSLKIYNEVTKKLYCIKNVFAEALILHHKDSWSIGIPVGEYGLEVEELPEKLVIFCFKYKRGVLLLDQQGVVERVHRTQIKQKLKTGYSFKSMAIRIYNLERRVWARLNQSTAKTILVENDAWEYGQPPIRNLTKITAKDI